MRSTATGSGHGLLIGIQKGGTGKTTISVNLSMALASLGYRVRLVDADDQGDAARHVGSMRGPESDLGEFLKERSSVAECDVTDPAWPSGFRFVRVGRTFDCDTYWQAKRRSRYTVVESSVQAVAQFRRLFEDVDVCLVDSNPDFPWITRVAYWACDTILMPVLPDEPSFGAMERTMERLEDLRFRNEAGIPACPNTRVVVNDVDPRNRQPRLFNEAFEASPFAGFRFKQEIGHRTELPQSWEKHRPVLIEKPRGRARAEFDELAREVASDLSL